MIDVGKENIGILDEISWQLYFRLESEPMLWCNYQLHNDANKRQHGHATVHRKTTKNSTRMTQQQSVIKVIDITRRLLLPVGALKICL